MCPQKINYSCRIDAIGPWQLTATNSHRNQRGADQWQGDLDVALAGPMVHEVELLVVDGVRAAGPHAERVEHHVPAGSTETT